jgi:ligand-binding sensor domain-containing protein
MNGISIFNPKTQVWKNITGITDFTRSVTVNDKNEVYFLSQNGLEKLSGEKPKLYQFPDNTKNVSSHFRLVYHQSNAWVFKRDGTVSYTLKNE